MKKARVPGVWAAMTLGLALAARAEPPGPSTFSIVAADPEAGEVGVAVASRFFAVGSVVPWARRAVDVRVDDHADPIVEIVRLTRLAVVNDTWNRGWTAFGARRYPEALRFQRQTAAMAEQAPALLPEVLYDLAVILHANALDEEAFTVLQRALAGNPKLREQALRDDDLGPLRDRLRK